MPTCKEDMGFFFSGDITGHNKGWEERRHLPFPLKAKEGQCTRNKLTSDSQKLPSKLLSMSLRGQGHYITPFYIDYIMQLIPD